MSTRTRVAVIGGGQNCEHEVSLSSAAAVAAALDARRHEVIALTIRPDGRWAGDDGVPLGATTAASLAAAVRVLGSCDVVLPVVHGRLGEDGTLAGLCALAGVPCAGSPLGAGALAMDKWATKLAAEAVGVTTARGRVVTAAEAPTVEFHRPVVVKPVSAGSSHGVSLARTAADLRGALAEALELDDRVLVEEVVHGREVDLAVAELPGGDLRISPPLEVLVDGGLFDTDTKYDGSARFLVPAPLTVAELGQLRAATERVYRALGCRGIARVDFFLTPSGPVLNEVNTMPGMTGESQVPRMFAADGWGYPALLDTWIEATLAASPARVRAA
ncbi:D-alanine--D-alanine ligase family protein [Tessaracoccus rhinocerotis]|uniref:D-alanine--D-alanine ligase family protein n=1 Tax=Tessaracoccus rhinocerotis TaxID=1689449 RepID=UPI001FE8365B|nr:D-alanine--D-alanine ligase [Tessaracoccus rhinocerotis]